MDWAKLPYFLAIARTGSLRAAADQLGATHATVDRNIRGLEQEYGVRLFDRSRSGLALTEAGRLLIPHAEDAETALIAARRKIQGNDTALNGRVRLSIPTGFAFMIVPDILARFEQAYPEIELEVAVTNRFEDLNRFETDVSLRIARSVEDDVVGRKVMDYAGWIYASQSYLDRHFATAGPDGEGLQWIGWGDTAPLPDWVRNSPFPKARLRYKLRSPTLVMSMVEAGMGMSFLPCFGADALKNVVPVPGTQPYWDRSIWLLLHTDLRNTTRVRAVVDFFAEELRALRPAFHGPLA